MANLQELFHCDYVTFDRTWTAAQQFVFEQTLSEFQEYVDYSAPDAATDAGLDAEFWKLYWLSDFCNYADRTGDITHVLKPNDFYSDLKWRTGAMSREFGLPGQSWEMSVYPRRARAHAAADALAGSHPRLQRARPAIAHPAAAAPHRRLSRCRAPSSGTRGVDPAAGRASCSTLHRGTPTRRWPDGWDCSRAP